MSEDLYQEHTSLMREAGVSFRKMDFASINKNDILMIIDCQNDFFPADSVEDGGRFGVADGDKIVPSVLELIDLFNDKNCTIVASKDFHSKHHCSFSTNGGGFPPHCIQGTKGAEFHKQIGEKLFKIKKEGADIIIGFKGVENNHESFSAYPYVLSTGKERFGPDFEVSEWCDCFALESSSADATIDSSPDIMAVLQKRSVSDLLKEKLQNENCHVYVCGLAFDFCVIDTAVNVVENGGKNVTIIHNATRASNIRGVGAFGSGFLTDPGEIARKLHAHRIAMADMY